MIETFGQLLFIMNKFGPGPVDSVSKLPEELSSMIFRYLDDESLLKAASVSRRWSAIIKSDPVLRRRSRRKIRAVRRLTQRTHENTVPQEPLVPQTRVQMPWTHPGVLQELVNGTVLNRADKIRYNETDLGKVQETNLTVIQSERVVKRKSRKVQSEKQKRVSHVEAPAKRMRML